MRVAPNNQYPATEFIQVFIDDDGVWYKCPLPICRLPSEVTYEEKQSGTRVIAIFRIRPNQVPTLHNFKPQQPCQKS